MKNLVKKELLLALRYSWWLLPCILIIQVGLPLFLLKDLSGATLDPGVKNQVFSGLILLYPIMSIPMAGALVFEQSLREERKQGIVQVLLANGVSVKALWRSKLSVVLGIGEAVNLLTAGCSIAAARVVQGEWLRFSGSDLFGFFVGVPFMALVFTTVLCLPFWLFRQGQLLTGMIPQVCFFACIFLTIFQVNPVRMITLPVGLGIAVGGTVVWILAEAVAGRVSKEYVSNL